MNKMPVFVKIDKYNDVLDIVRLIKKKVDEAKNTLAQIRNLKNEEDHQLELWQNSIAEVEKRLEFVNQTLNEPEQY